MKMMITASAVLAGFLAVPVLALAAPAAADAGGYCSQPGCSQLRTPGAPGAGSQNGTGAGSGAFGAFGTFGDVAHDFRGGADGTQTGLNNSSVSGNRTVDQPTPRVHPVPQN